MKHDVEALLRKYVNELPLTDEIVEAFVRTAKRVKLSVETIERFRKAVERGREDRDQHR